MAPTLTPLGQRASGSTGIGTGNYLGTECSKVLGRRLWAWFRVEGLFFGGILFFVFGTLSLFFLRKQHVLTCAISLGFPKKTFIPFFVLKRTKRRKEGRKEGRKQGNKEGGRKQGRRKEARKQERRKKERRKEGGKEGRKKGRKQGRRKEGRKEGRKQRKQGSEEARKEDRRKGRKGGNNNMNTKSSSNTNNK